MLRMSICAFCHSGRQTRAISSAAGHVGARELLRVIERFGHGTFKACIERMYEHGEHVVREFVRTIPDGTYRATCHMDNNGLDDNPIQFEVVVTIDDSDVRMDF